MVPEGQVVDTRGGTIFTFVYWKESFKMKHQANFNQTWNKHFLHVLIGIQIYSVLFKGGDNHKNRVGSFKYFLLMNHSTIKAQIYMSASLYSAESILFNSWSLGVMRGHNRVKHQWGKSLKISSRNH
jgi:hypothetical protein